ncbi:MAG: hypothetical protein WC755_03655 [Candidatus Woesearchaeota archaeon]|jgi:rubrerythrin
MAMEIFEMARNLELEGKALYEKRAKVTKSENLKKVLNMIAKVEENHFDLFVEIQKNKKAGPIKHVDFKIAKQAFGVLRDEKFTNEEIKDFEKMLVVEKKSEDYYKLHANDVSANTELILEIAKEEHRHYVLIQNLIELLRRPKQWVESEEFKRLDNY